MSALDLSPKLQKEFQTVAAIWSLTDASTCSVDALLLSWVKLEKQLRRLFCCLVYQHDAIDGSNVKEVIDALVANDRLSPRVFIKGIEELGAPTVRDMLGPEYDRLHGEICRIREVRNKLAHGQITGRGLGSHVLEQDTRLVIEWVAGLAEGAHRLIGYDGLGRNTFLTAKKIGQAVVAKYPFTTPQEFRAWLDRVSNLAKAAAPHL